MRHLVMPRQDREDERLLASVASSLLNDLHVYRCSRCALVLVHADALFRANRHAGCGGCWNEVSQPLHRAVLIRFLTREMLGGGPFREGEDR
jgi:hypothetical protein